MFYHNNRMQLPFSIPFVTRDLHVSIISEYSIQRSRTQTSWTYFVRYNQSHYLPACLAAVAPLPVAVSVSKWIYSQQIYQSTLLHFYCDCGLNYYSWCPLETPRDFFAQQHQSLLYDYLSLATKTPSCIHHSKGIINSIPPTNNPILVGDDKQFPWLLWSSLTVSVQLLPQCTHKVQQFNNNRME